MSELLTMQDLANGHLDVKALGEAANGDENTIVTTRTGNTYPSAERAINIMFQNGGLPAEPFATKAQMETDGASLLDGQLAQVYNETANNGLYVKEADAWVKSSYDPLSQAKNYTDDVALIKIDNLIANGDFSNGLVGWSATNAPTIDTSIYHSAPQSLKVNSVGSSAQVDRTITAIVGHKYYFALRAKLTRRSAGTIGAQIEGYGSNFILGTTAINTSFERFSAVRTATTANTRIFAGALSSANLDGNIDDLILVDLSAAFGIGNEPELADLEQTIKGDYFTSKRLGVSFLYNKINRARLLTNHPIADCNAAFINAMNAEAVKIGMLNTNYVNPHGLEDEMQISTAKDTLKLAVRATAYKDIVQIWSKKTYSFKSGVRDVTVNSTVQDAEMESHYPILGGKTGTNAAPYATSNVVLVVPAPNNNLFVGCVIEASINRFSAAKQLFDIASQITNGQTPSPAAVAANKACVAYVPASNVFMYESYFDVLWGKNEDVVGHQASITKIMTAIIMLKYIADVDQVITLPRSISIPYLYKGETITYRDLLYSLLLPSSNDVASFISEHIGNMILNKLPTVD